MACAASCARAAPVARRHSSPRAPPRRLAARAHGHGHGHGGGGGGAAAAEDGTFLAELRAHAMRLHTRQQAPREGQAEEPDRPMSKWEPTREGYLQYLVDAKAVFDALEEVVGAAPAGSALAALQGTGLERGAALAADLAYFEAEHGLAAPAPTEAGAGYAAFLRGKAAAGDVPAFMCHYYNVYFAHTAGGRQIGKMLADATLEGHTLGFYKWEGVVLKDAMDGVRGTINAMAEGWSQEERQACLDETAPSFKYAGEMMRTLAK